MRRGEADLDGRGGEGGAPCSPVSPGPPRAFPGLPKLSVRALEGVESSFSGVLAGGMPPLPPDLFSELTGCSSFSPSVSCSLLSGDLLDSTGGMRLAVSKKTRSSADSCWKEWPAYPFCFCLPFQ